MNKAYAHIDIAWDRLREYLSGRFDNTLTDFQSSCLFSEQEARRWGDDFYSKSDAYLYELTHFHFSSFKDAFFDMLIDYACAHRIRTLADVGCGVGLDGQALSSIGFEVSFFDLPSSSTDYLCWRLDRDINRRVEVRGLASIRESQADLAYMVDVLEHTPTPGPILRDLCATFRHICLNLFPHSRKNSIAVDLHYPLDHWSLLPILDESHSVEQVAVSGDTVAMIWRRRDPS